MRGSLCWAYLIQACDQWSVVSDSGNNRVKLSAIDGALIS